MGPASDRGPARGRPLPRPSARPPRSQPVTPTGVAKANRCSGRPSFLLTPAHRASGPPGHHLAPRPAPRGIPVHSMENGRGERRRTAQTWRLPQRRPSLLAQRRRFREHGHLDPTLSSRAAAPFPAGTSATSFSEVARKPSSGVQILPADPPAEFPEWARTHGVVTPLPLAADRGFDQRTCARFDAQLRWRRRRVARP
jgi:hypothetical protein